MTAYEYRMRAEEQHAEQAAQRGAEMAIMSVGLVAMVLPPGLILVGLGLVSAGGLFLCRPRTINAVLWAGLGCLVWYLALYAVWHSWAAAIPLIPPIERNGLPLPISVPPSEWMQTWVLDRGAAGLAAIYATSVSRGLLDMLWSLRAR